MANIFLAFRAYLNKEKDMIPIFYEGLAKALARNGNNVLLWNEMHYTTGTETGLSLSSSLYKRRAQHKINKFFPDAVISFNNILPTEVEAMISAPIALYSADSVYNFYNLERIKEKTANKKYCYLASTKYCITDYKQYFSAEDNNIHYVPAATEVQAISTPQDKNISFIGTNFLACIPPVDFHGLFSLYKKVFQYVFTLLQKNFLYTFEEILLFTLEQFPGIPPVVVQYAHILFTQNLPKSVRIDLLNSIADLGLHLYGSDSTTHVSWDELFSYNIPLGLCWEPEFLYSLSHNQSLYNATKIGLNISHPQALTGFSWRVQDIMASNACLLMEQKVDFNTLFSQYFDASSIDAMLFTNKYELRSKAERLLQDEPLRRAIVEQSQNAIEQCGRWEHRLPTLEEAFGISLHNNKNGKTIGNITVLTL